LYAKPLKQNILDNHNSGFLSRKLGLFSVTNIVIANMIGAGIFTTSGLLMADLKDPMLMLWLWVFGGVLAFAGAMCYGEIGASIPKAGGEYAFLSHLYSPRLGFLSGWVSFIVGFSAPIAASSIGFSEYLYRALPHIFDTTFLSVEAMKKLYSILIIVIFTLVHLRGLEFGAKVQNYLTLLKIALVAGLILFGFSLGNGDISNFKYTAPESQSTIGWKTIGLSLMWIMFAFSGWNASVYIGSEIKKPERNIPLSLLIGTGIVAVLYLLLNILFIYAIPPREMENVISIGGLAIGNLFGADLEAFFSLLVAFALFSSISAFIILGPRVYFAMSSDGHFFKFAAKVDSKYQVPVYSIIFQAIISVIIILSGTFDQILTYMGFSLGIFPIITIFGLFKLRKKGLSKLKLPGYPVTPVLYILAGIIMLILSFLERPLESSIAILTILIGFPAYYLFGKEKTRG
jgi:basic amino acid/polyamine antiporter, APA family